MKNLTFWLTGLRGLLMFFSSHLFMFWIFMEINIISFLVVLYFEHPVLPFRPLNYFFPNVVASGSFLLAQFFYLNHIIISYVFLILFFILKLGVPPFHRWVVMCTKGLTIASLFFILILQKTPFLLLISFQLKILKVLVVLRRLALRWVLSVLKKQKSLLRVLIISSFVSIFYLIPLLRIRINLFILGLTVYFWVFLKSLVERAKKNLGLLNQKKIALLNLRGLPPFMMFILKVLVLWGLAYYSLFFVRGVFLGGRIFLLFIYLTVIFIRIIKNFQKKNYMLRFMCLLLFIFFIL